MATLDVSLDPVPKMLGKIKAEWNPSTLAVSFKLETDLAILEKKALGAISNYKVDCVVANELHSRRFKVIIYEKDSSKVIEVNPEEQEIEAEIINYLQNRFKNH